MSVERYLFLMNGWASTAGGIQTVNRELVSALAAHRSYAGFTVLVPQASQEEISDATSRGVQLISGGGTAPDDWVSALMSPALAQVDAGQVVALVGHSTFSGDQARLLRDRHFPNAQLVQFIHMSPLRTEGLKEYRQDNYVAVREEKVRREQEIAAAADIVICIGPRLYRLTRDALVARGIAAGRINALSCGLAPPTMLRDPPLNPTILCLGRTDSLGVKGLDIFAYAAGHLTEAWKGHPFTSGRPAPSFVIRGVKGDGEALEKHLTSLAEEVGSRPSLTARPYTTHPVDLAADYAGASIFMMPSREEGFGLVACEGLSQGVPVLLSEESGIAELARQVMGQHHLKEQPCVVSMQGNAKEIGQRFANAALEILVDEELATSYYQALRERMLPIASWNAGAVRFLEIVDQARANPKSSVQASPQIEVASTAAMGGTLPSPADLTTQDAKEELLAKKGVMAVSLKQAFLVIVERGQRPNLPSEIGGIEVVVREVDAIKLSSDLSTSSADGLYFDGRRTASVAAVLAAPDNTLYAITAAHAIQQRSMYEFEVKVGSLNLSVRGVTQPTGLDLALVELPKHPFSKRPWEPAAPEMGERVTIRIGDRKWNARIATVELTARIEGVDGGPLRNLFEVTVDGSLPPGASGALVEGASGRPVGVILATMFETKGFPTSYVAQEFSDLNIPGYSVARLRPVESRLTVAVVSSSSEMLAALASIDAVNWMPGSTFGNGAMMGRVGGSGPIITAMTSDRFGAVGTAIATMQALYTQMPDVIIHLGLCAGLEPEGQSIGDVILSTEVISYVGGARRSDRYFPNIQILSERRPKLRHQLQAAISTWWDLGFGIHFGPMAAVDFVVSDSAQLAGLKEVGRNLLGLNMESAGFAQAVQDSNVPAPAFMLLVNGVSDLADGRKVDKGRKRAAMNASLVLVELVRALDNMEDFNSMR